jgi:thiol-disulfide isomerase/thioredoxin
LEPLVGATTVAGGELRSTDVAGKPVVAWFWAPWCTTCRSEAPTIKTVQAEYADRVTFVGVAGLGELPAMRSFVSTTNLSAFPHVVDDDGTIWSTYKVSRQPAYAFIAPDGQVETVRGTLDESELRDRLNRLTD